MANNNTGLVRTALFVRDLLGLAESSIRIGREGFRRQTFDTAYIVVDDVGPFQRIGSGDEFDDVNENMTYDAVWRGTVTLDFYGPDAYGVARDFVLKMRSQAAYDLKASMAAAGTPIELHQPGPITDVKKLTGQQYGERMQVEIVVEISEGLVIPTLRIDTAQLSIIDEEGTIL